jgi:1-acyl-sn-glycerol-3-phosphate acyltransferase
MQSFFVQLNTYLTRRKIPFFTLLVLLLVLAGYLASRVKLEENLNAIIPEDQRISQISAAFDRSDLVDQIVFMLSMKDSTARDPEKLIVRAEQLVGKLEAASDLVGSVSFRVANDAMMEVYDLLYDNLPLFLEEEDYWEIADRLGEAAIEETIAKDFRILLTPAGLATRRFILKDPLNLTPLVLDNLNRFQLDDNFQLYNSVVFTADRKYLLFFLDPVHSGANTSENRKLITYIDGVLEGFAKEAPDLKVEYYGGTAVAVANSVRVKKDIVLTLSIALAFFLLVFLAYFRRFSVMLLMFVPVLIGAVISVAMLSLLYGRVSAIALGVGVIFIGITVDYSLHLFTHLRSGGKLQQTLGRIAIPVLMSSLTTASAFLCLNIIRSEAMQQIGVFAAFAVVISALSLLIVTPLLIGNREGSATRYEGGGKEGTLHRLLGYRFENSRLLVAVLLALTLLFAFTSRKIRFNGDISTLNYQTESLSRSEATLRSISSVANSSVYLLTRAAGLEEALEKLEASRELLTGCLDQGLVTEMSWVPDLMLSRQAQEERIRRWHRFWDEAGREQVRRRITESGMRHHFREEAFEAFYSLINKDFEPIPMEEYGLLRELFLDTYISEEEGQCSLVTILKVDPRDKQALFDRISARGDFIIFDNQYFINRFFEVLKEDFNKLVLISMSVVFLILLLFFGRIEIALATFIPIMISWLWTLGLMGLFGIEINIFNIIISTFIFGLGIDYCIFIMNGLMANYREGEHSLVPYKLSILLSALTTIAAIGVLVFARHPALNSIAVVSIFGITTVLLMAYTLLPILFRFLTESQGRSRLQPLTLGGVLGTLLTFIPFLGMALLVTVLLPLLILLPVRRRLKKRILNQMIYLYSKFIVYLGFFIRKEYLNRELLDFSRPSVIISNHQSQLDLLLLLHLHPKMIVLVNKWVWNNPFYGFVIRYADYYPVYKGLDYRFDLLKRKVEQGYSILAFPEASRSPDGGIKRFHQGALGIADMLGLEIQPVMIHGAYDCLPKTEHVLKSGTITLKVFPRVRPRYQEHEGMKTYRLQARELTAFYRDAYRKLKEELETPDYYRGRLIKSYMYKGPVLEYYLRVKLRLEKNYRFFNWIIPRDAVIADLGCGYGFLSVMLGMVSPGRQITGIDYDGYKIAVAGQVARNMEHVHFIRRDIVTADLPEAGVYVLNDVLHYLPETQQLEVLARCLDSLPEQGMVILRDADAGMRRRTLVTRFTEWQSTRVFRFNLARNRLSFLPAERYEQVIREKGFTFTKYDHARFTSNVTYVIRRQTGEGT